PVRAPLHSAVPSQSPAKDFIGSIASAAFFSSAPNTPLTAKQTERRERNVLFTAKCCDRARSLGRPWLRALPADNLPPARWRQVESSPVQLAPSRMRSRYRAIIVTCGYSLRQQSGR